MFIKNSLIIFILVLSLPVFSGNGPGGPGYQGGSGSDSLTSLDCSNESYKDSVVINEIYQSSGKFVEIKFLDEVAIASNDQWQLCVLRSDDGSECFDWPDANQTYLIGSYEVNNLNFSSYGSGSGGGPGPGGGGSAVQGANGEIVLLDGSGDVLDAWRFCNASTCAERKWSIPEACLSVINHSPSNKDIARRPDGTGVPQDNESKPTKGSDNDGGTPIAYFALDEFSLDGTSGETVDGKGLSTTASAIGTDSGVAPNSEGKVCYGVDIPFNDERYNYAYAIDTGLNVTTDIGNKGSIDFWYRNEEAWNSGAERTLFDASNDNNDNDGDPKDHYFSLSIDDTGKLHFGVEDDQDNDLELSTTQSFSFSEGTWTHIAVTWSMTTKSAEIYVNGVEQSLSLTRNNTLSSATIGNLWSLYFGDNRSSYLEGSYLALGTQNSAKGRFDEIYIYNGVISADQVVADMNATHACNNPPVTEQPADAFNCVYTGLDAASGNLYTRIAGTAFNFDVVALDASNAVETDFAADANRSVTVELVDTSSGAACASLSAITPAVSQSLTFTSADAGRKASANMTVNKAYKSVGCRVTDATDSPSVVGCSIDSFSIRPSSLTLSVPTLTNSGSSGDPHAKAGSSFTLNVTSIAGYDGTPIVAGSLEAHAGAITTGTLMGNFSAADPSTGTATGSDFAYNEVGNFRFSADAIRDTSFTAVDQTSDCIDNSYSNTLSSGKVGCDFSNGSASDWVGRFTPDHFSVVIDENGELENTCSAGGFSYFGTDIPFSVDPSVTITALNSDDETTTNYTGSYGKLVVGDINMPSISGDGTSNGVDGSTKVGLTWNAGSTNFTNSNGVITFALSGDTFVYSRDENDLVAPFTADVDLIINSIIDSDSIEASSLPQTISPTGVNVRYGRLNILNAYGSELQTLAMTMQTEYYNGSGNGFIQNTDDTCTSISTVTLSGALSSGSSCVLASANNGDFCLGNVIDDHFATTPLSPDYDFNLNLKAPGENNTGVLNVTVSAPDHLDYDWLGAGNSDPTATATFGIHNRNNNLIFFKEVR